MTDRYRKLDWPTFERRQQRVAFADLHQRPRPARRPWWLVVVAVVSIVAVVALVIWTVES